MIFPLSAVTTTNKSKRELLRAVSAVVEWATSEKMVLNADKCEVAFFITNSREANWQPTIIANNARLYHNPQPKFLGVTLDRLLTFGSHIQNISKRRLPGAECWPPSLRRRGCGERTS